MINVAIQTYKSTTTLLYHEAKLETVRSCVHSLSPSRRSLSYLHCFQSVQQFPICNRMRFWQNKRETLLHKIKEKKRNERLAGSAEDWNDDRRRGIRWRDSDRCRYSRLYWCVMLIDCVTCVCVCLIKLVCF